MKYVKMLGLAAMALAALMAFAGTASASTATSPKGTVYTGNIKAESEGTTSLTSSFFGTVACKTSVVEGKVEKQGIEEGKTVAVSGALSSLTFTECTGGSPTSPVTKRGTLSVTGIAPAGTAGGGTAVSSGAEVTVHNTLVGTCTFTTSNTDIGTVTDSDTTKGNATLDIGSVNIPQTGSNPFCPSSAVWEGSYKVTTPATLYID